MKKDSTITELLDWLREKLADGFTVTDHWEADRCAIGIAAPDDPEQLAYISSNNKLASRYYVKLESSALNHQANPPITTFDSVNRDELLKIVTKHLGISKKQGLP
jgi:hypothetical protein